MAKEMKHRRWDDFGPKKANQEMKYPWHQWLNGSMWLLVQGEDFLGDTEVFRRYLLNYCSKHNIKVKTKRAENRRDLYIKVTNNTVKDGIRRARHFRALERRYEQLHDEENQDKSNAIKSWERYYDPDLDVKDF